MQESHQLRGAGTVIRSNHVAHERPLPRLIDDDDGRGVLDATLDDMGQFGRMDRAQHQNAARGTFEDRCEASSVDMR